MPDRQLYTLSIPKFVQDAGGGTDLSRQLSTAGVLTEGLAQAEGIATNPDERRFTGYYAHDTYGSVMAAEFEELFGSNDVPAVPYFVTSGSDPRNAYYELGNARVEPGHPASDGSDDGTPAIYQVRTASLTKVGSRSSHWRALSTDQETVTNDFGASSTAHVGVSAQADKIRWFNSDTLAREQPALVATRTGETGDVEIYDVDAASFSNPTLIYDLDYSNDGRVDCVVWDTRGQASRDDADGRPQWQQVFDTSHDYTGTPVVSNHVLRLTFDDANNSLSAEDWDTGTGSWSAVSLGTSDWELYDTDVSRIGLARVEAQVEFRDTTQSPTAFYSLDMVLHRGGQDAQWLRPANESNAAPSGLQTLLNPIATTSDLDPGERKTLTPRSEARK